MILELCSCFKSSFVTGGHHNSRYSIYSGDPDGFFKIDSVTGTIRTASALDREIRANILLNIQATNGDPPVYGHTQVSKNNLKTNRNLTLINVYLNKPLSSCKNNKFLKNKNVRTRKKSTQLARSTLCKEKNSNEHSRVFQTLCRDVWQNIHYILIIFISLIF